MPSHGQRQTRPANKIKATLVALLCGTALIGAVPAGALADPGAAPEGGMNLEFARDTVRTVGPGALVFVKCTGSEDGICTGILTLSVAGTKHKVPFSVRGGVSQNVVVPLDSEAVGNGTKALGTASTAQPIGAYAQSTEVLRFK